FNEANLPSVLAKFIDSHVFVAAKDAQRRHEINGLRLFRGVDVTFAAADFLPFTFDCPCTVRFIDKSQLLGVVFGDFLAIDLERYYPPGALIVLPLLLDGVLPCESKGSTQRKKLTDYE